MLQSIGARQMDNFFIHGKNSPFMYRIAVGAVGEPRTAGKFAYRSGSSERIYRHPTVAIHLHLYAGVFESGGGRVEFESGDFTVTPPHRDSRYRVPQGGWHYCTHFAPPTASRKPLVSLPPRIPARLGPGIAAMERLIHWHRDRRAEARAAARYALRELLLALALGASEPGGETSPGEGAVGRLKRLLDQRFAENVPVGVLCREAGRSQNLLASEFRQVEGCTIKEYLQRRRAEYALELLASTRLSVKEIAAACGYYDVQHLNKSVRHRYGDPPLRLRERLAG